MKKTLSPKQRDELITTLHDRFGKNMRRHPDAEWPQVLRRLEAQPGKLWSLAEMERTGGEPDVVGRDAISGEWLFADCSAESPAGRRSLCYDRAALDARKQHKPAGSALDLAAEMGVEMLTEEQYHGLQSLGPFDLKTSSWVLTPDAMRRLGGALFGDSRYGRVFFYHNGAESYYGSRGFRACLRV